MIISMLLCSFFLIARMNDIVKEMVLNTKAIQPVDASVISTKRRFVVSYLIPSSRKSGIYIKGQRLFLDQPLDKNAKQIIQEMRAALPTECKGYDFLLKYKNILYADVTIAEMQITNDEVIELECLSQNREATHNEGFFFFYWSLFPLIFAIPLGLSGLLGTFDFFTRASYVVVAILIAFPSFTFMLLGLSELFPVLTGTSMVGQYWFCSDCSVILCCRRGNSYQPISNYMSTE